MIFLSLLVADLTGWAAIITALGALVTALGGLSIWQAIDQHRDRKNSKALHETVDVIKEQVTNDHPINFRDEVTALGKALDRIELKLDDSNSAHNRDIKLLDEKIDRLASETLCRCLHWQHRWRPRR